MRRIIYVAALAGAIAALAACPDGEPALGGVQSLAVTIDSPADPGSENSRIDYATVSSVTVEVQAINIDGTPDTKFGNDLGVYVQFLGTLTPYLCDPANSTINPTQPPCSPPLATVHMSGGASTGPTTINLPPVFGPTTIWLDDGHGSGSPTYVAGSSPTLWYRDPFIVDTQKPANEMALDALTTSPLSNKNVSILASRYGSKGRMVVTSVFAQGYTVADVQCTDDQGTPPCTSQDYDYEEVFSFSAPSDQNGCFLVEGQTIDGFSGGMSDFDGLTEVGFPQTFVSGTSVSNCTTADVNTAREPATAKFDPSWFTNKIDFERNEAGAIEVDNAVMCNLDADFDTFNQWKLDPTGVGGDCSKNDNVINLVTAGVVQGLDTAHLTSLQGKTFPKVVGILRPINIGSFNIWIIYPRGDADLVLPN